MPSRNEGRAKEIQDLAEYCRLLLSAEMRLFDALKAQQSVFTHESAIHRFENCFDAAYIAAETFAHLEGHVWEPKSHSRFLAYAHSKHWIKNVEDWRALCKRRVSSIEALHAEEVQAAYYKIFEDHARLIDFLIEIVAAVRACEDPDFEKFLGPLPPSEILHFFTLFRRGNSTYLVLWHADVYSQKVTLFDSKRDLGKAASMEEAVEKARVWLEAHSEDRSKYE
jgi:hypothetical protein